MIDTSLPQMINYISCFVISIVCALTILHYHRQIGGIVTLSMFVLMLCSIGIIVDDSDGERYLWSIPIFRTSAALASAVTYIRMQRFWQRYGRYLSVVMGR